MKTSPVITGLTGAPRDVTTIALQGLRVDLKRYAHIARVKYKQEDKSLRESAKIGNWPREQLRASRALRKALFHELEVLVPLHRLVTIMVDQRLHPDTTGGALPRLYRYVQDVPRLHLYVLDVLVGSRNCSVLTRFRYLSAFAAIEQLVNRHPAVFGQLAYGRDLVAPSKGPTAESVKEEARADSSSTPVNYALFQKIAKSVPLSNQEFDLLRKALC